MITAAPARTVPAVPVDDLLSRHRDAWRPATHPFLDAVRDGTVPVAAFDTWLVQGSRFVTDLLRFRARLLARASRQAQAVLAGGLVGEFAWSEEQAAVRGRDLEAVAMAATAAHAGLLGRLDAADVGAAPTALRTTERTHLDAWWATRPGAPEYREFVDHWTLPGFTGHVAGCVAGLEAAADGVPAPDPDAVFAEVVAAEVASWDMALDSARWDMAMEAA